MKFTAKNGSDYRPKGGEFSTTTLVELTPDASLGRVPANVLFLVDSSSSMGGDKWAMVKGALTELVGALKDDDRVSLVLFGTNAREVFPLASLSQNRKAMQDAITKLDNPSGVTNLEQGLQVAYKTFEARDQADRIKRVNHVILLTDGFPTDNQGYRLDKLDKFEKIVGQHEHITLTGIGIGSADDYDSDFISRLSEVGRGSYYHANAMEKFREGLQAEMQKLQSSVVGDLTMKFSGVSARVMRIARVAPEIVIYDIPGNAKQFELPTGSMTRDRTAFLVQTMSNGPDQSDTEVPLFSVQASYDGKSTEQLNVVVRTTENQAHLGQVDQDVFRASQLLQVHLNGQQIQASLQSGDKDKATRLIQNTTRIASNLGQDKVTRALTRLASDMRSGKSAANELATIKDEAKKTRLLIS